MYLREGLIRLAYERPELRKALLPVLLSSSDNHRVSADARTPLTQKFVTEVGNAVSKALRLPVWAGLDRSLHLNVLVLGNYMVWWNLREDLSLYGFGEPDRESGHPTTGGGFRLKFSGSTHPKWKGDLDTANLSAREIQRYLVKAIVDAFKRLPFPKPVSAPQEQDWSVAQTGPDGYVNYVEVYGSKSDAERHAKDIGDAYVMKGTQMWNEPLGQIEESDRPAKYRYFQ